MSLVLQVADVVAPADGLRTAMNQLALGYATRGCQVVQVLPGRERLDVPTAFGRRVELPAPAVPRTGYRILPGPRDVRRLVRAVGPDRLEVFGGSTLRSLGPWAHGLGLPAVLVDHERLDLLLATWTDRAPGALGHRMVAGVDHRNRRLAAGFDTVVCTSDRAVQAYRRAGVRHVVQVPIGVDLQEFRPDRASPWVRETLAPRGESLLVTVSRLGRHKRVDRAIDTVAELTRRGRRVRLLVIGEGPLRRRLERHAAGLPVRFVGQLDDRHRLATILACADVTIVPGPGESLGLVTLESLASGTPVVVDAGSALHELLGPEAGLAAAGGPEAFADGVEGMLDGPADRRRAARSRAEQFGWDRTVQGFLDLHRLPYGATAGAAQEGR